jgi:hypothetical protein
MVRRGARMYIWRFPSYGCAHSENNMHQEQDVRQRNPRLLLGSTRRHHPAIAFGCNSHVALTQPLSAPTHANSQHHLTILTATPFPAIFYPAPQHATTPISPSPYRTRPSIPHLHVLPPPRLPRLNTTPALPFARHPPSTHHSTTTRRSRRPPEIALLCAPTSTRFGRLVG